MVSNKSKSGRASANDRIFYCPDIPVDILERDTTSVDLPENEARHINRVLRLRSGDTIRLFDGRGRLYGATTRQASKQTVVAEITHLLDTEKSPEQGVSLIVGTLKAKKSDLVVEKCVELGVEKIIFFEAGRSVAHKAEKQKKTIERWEKIVVSACKQCCRSRLMQVDLCESLSEAIEKTPSDSKRLAFWEEAHESRNNISAADDAAGKTPYIALVGPEGGLTAEEIDIALEANFDILSLGPRILRAETACIVTATLLQERSGAFGKYFAR